MKKAQLGLDSLGTAAIEIVTVVLVISIGALLLTSFGASAGMGNLTEGYQTASLLAINNGSSGLGVFGSYIPTIALIMVFLVILGMVLIIWKAFSARQQPMQ